MTDAEIKAENEKNGLNGEKDKGQFKFLQKYYHPGMRPFASMFLTIEL
jgi:hypothetical protein